MDFESEYPQGRYVGRGCTMRLGAPSLNERAFSALVAHFASIALATMADLKWEGSDRPKPLAHSQE